MKIRLLARSQCGSSAGLLAFLGALSLAAYWLIATRLDHAGGARDLRQFLGLFGGLFEVYFLAIGLTSVRLHRTRRCS